MSRGEGEDEGRRRSAQIEREVTGEGGGGMRGDGRSEGRKRRKKKRSEGNPKEQLGNGGRRVNAILRTFVVYWVCCPKRRENFKVGGHLRPKGRTGRRWKRRDGGRVTERSHGTRGQK